jgi:hypothetical protein
MRQIKLSIDTPKDPPPPPLPDKGGLPQKKWPGR